MSERSDRELVHMAQQGDAAAYDAPRKYQNRVLNLIRNYVSDRTMVYDVAQEAFLKAWRGLPRFRGDSQFYTWLFRIAVNCAKNHLFAQKRRNERLMSGGQGEDDGPSIEELLVDETTPAQEEEARQLEEALNKALLQLSEELRVAITLCEIEGMTYEEIAHVVQCPVGTVRSRIFRARQALEQSLKPYLQGGLKK